MCFSLVRLCFLCLRPPLVQQHHFYVYTGLLRALNLTKNELNITRENYELDSKTENSEIETTSENYEVDMNWSWSESSGFDIKAEYNSEFDNIKFFLVVKSISSSLNIF